MKKVFFLVEINATKFLRSISGKLFFFLFQSETTNTNAKSTIYLMRKLNHSLCVLHTHALHAFSARTGRNLLVARVKFELRVCFESGFKFFTIFFLLVFPFSISPNDVRRVTRNISFPVADIF